MQQESFHNHLFHKRMLNHLAPLETQNSFTVFMQTLKVRLELSEKLWLYSNKKYDTKQKQPPEVFLEISQNSHENTCASQSLFLIKLQALRLSCRSATLLKKETLAQFFSCEFCKISKNTFFTEHLWMAASN